MKHLGELIRTDRSGFTIREVSKILDIGESYWSAVESGRKKPSRDQLYQICQFLHGNEDEYTKHYLSDQILRVHTEEPLLEEALEMALQKLREKSRQGTS